MSMQSFSLDVDGEYVAVQDGTDAVSVLISRLTSMNITPREEHKVGSVSESTFVVNVKPGEEHSDADFTDYMCWWVHDVPLNASSADLQEAFVPTSDVKGIWVPFQEFHSIIIFAIPRLEDMHLTVKYVSTEQIERVIGKSVFVDEMDGTLYVSVADHHFQSAVLQNVLASFSKLMLHKAVDLQEQNFQIEYYDARDAANGYHALHDHTFLGVHLPLLTKKDA
ncbi:uncharacterized protein LAESUDRAFT_761452 [Laetiporus sulphureus 93-53]|uniref:Uncharacterized protein n=1 Tax=Laetiporus sulphureus 93-53 TaxID=1314785 RepID=A0A165D3R1_9APHY|nr:uncharacterized protein LAESUDRAFT_761452 [Laetiporus sulphureus 93-53]KZT04099.1 hypothetical protein LAESUDRAFT_761452 [Laetiporus sulphureus 93-53]